VPSDIREEQNLFAPRLSGDRAARPDSRQSVGQRLLENAANLPQFIADLLAIQAMIAAGSEAVGFQIETRKEGGSVHLSPHLIAHMQPESTSATVQTGRLQIFQEILRPCLANSQDAAIEIQTAEPGRMKQFCLVTLLSCAGEVVAVTAVITSCPGPERAQQLLVAMQLAAGYFDRPITDHASEPGSSAVRSHQEVLQLIASVAATEGFETAARDLCNELASRTGASRVSIGWLQGRRIKVRAMSHSERFDCKQELTVRIQKAMEECLDQEELVRFDQTGPGSATVSREAAALGRSEGNECVLSLPLRQRGEVAGVVTLEFAISPTVTGHTLNVLAVAVDLLAPQLADRYHNDRCWLVKTGDALRQSGEKLLGPTHTLTKAVLLVVLICSWLISPWAPYVPIYQVKAPFQFVPLEKRQMTAPFNGYLAKYFVLPGDRVHKGEPLARMDTKELELQRNEAESRILSLQRKADAFGADPAKQAERQIALAERLEAAAHRDLLSLQIGMASIVAPVDGEVLTGDLRDKIGSPLKVGEVMMEVADPGRLRVELAVQDRDIQDVRLAQTGALATSSLPGDRYPFTVSRIVPLGEAKEGTNVFKVYGQLDTSVQGGRAGAEQWRPGMTGEARIDIGKASLFWQWTHRLADFIRLKTWL
jgi:hypothetical protein